MGKPKTVRKMMKREYGFIVRAEPDDKLVAASQKRALADHKMEVSRETILAMAQPDPGR